jgi:glucosamine--fructose-6-phosphate aminotransferase (isomerizing)
MTDMIAAEPAHARRLLVKLADDASPAAQLAEAIRATVAAGEPVTLVGCGTSEHASLAAADILREAAVAAGQAQAIVASEQAFEAAQTPPASGLVVGVSHEGGTAATNAALAAARAGGRATAAITVTSRSPIAALADIVVETDELDQGWCHIIGYLSPIVAAAAVGAHLSGRPLDPDAVAALLDEGGRDGAGAGRIAEGLAGSSRIIVVASGADRPAGREITLKIEEASWLPTAYRDLETFLHGHLPATDATTGLILVMADRDHRAARLARARQALAAARVLGLRATAFIAADADAELAPALTPLGRLRVAENTGLPTPVAALLGTATPLQLLTERIARARGTDPDPIRRDDPLYVAASEAADH